MLLGRLLVGSRRRLVESGARRRSSVGPGRRLIETHSLRNKDESWKEINSTIVDYSRIFHSGNKQRETKRKKKKKKKKRRRRRKKKRGKRKRAMEQSIAASDIIWRLRERALVIREQRSQSEPQSFVKLCRHPEA